MAHGWMRHEETGGIAQLPDTPYWRARGWAPADGPPEERDPTDEYPQPPAAPAPAVVEDDEASDSAPADEDDTDTEEGVSNG